MRCPACGCYNSSLLIDLGKLPLSVLNLASIDPTPLYTIYMVTCTECTHVYNVGYDPDFKQCDFAGCTMYNSGEEWQKHMEDVAWLVNANAKGLIVEIGAGNGEFAKMLRSKCVAFEPVKGSGCADVVETRHEFFTAEHIHELRPSVIVMRHVLEHFADPGEFLSSLSRAAFKHDTTLIIEVPNVKNAIVNQRLEDWVYEHPQHFTDRSLQVLLDKSGWQYKSMTYMYNDEVLLVKAKAKVLKTACDLSKASYNFDGIRNMLLRMGNAKERLVFWGGAGKGANMINLLDVPPEMVTVVDSDPRKVGKYVPGTKHLICSPDVLEDGSAILATTSWRVGDIAKDMKRRGIIGDLVSIECGKLKPYEEYDVEEEAESDTK